MIEFTQSSLDPGNCWQTCIACLLEINPNKLPDQTRYDRLVIDADGNRRYEPPSYYGALQSYLRKHHGLAYVEFHQPPEAMSMLRVQDPGWHMLTGRTVRSATNGNQRHVVVARYGETVWDPHPSRAGLLDEINLAILVPYPKAWFESDVRMNRTPSPCECSECA